MRTTKYTITSKRIIALALVLVLITTMFVGCNSKKEDEPPTTITEVQTSIETVSEIVTDDKGETVTDDNGEALTTEVTKVVKVESQSDTNKNNETSSKKSDSNTSTTKSSTTTITNQTESTTKKNTSTGISDKTTTTNKPVVTACNHTWNNWKNIRIWTQERTCTKCGWIEEREVDNRNDYMGNKSEYLEFLALVNKARKAEGLKEVQYLDIAQEGANTRAQEITVKFSHTRPNGKQGMSAVGECIAKANIANLAACNENIVGSVVKTPEQAFNSWMNSAGHRANILSDGISYIVVARCSGYWVMIGIAIVEGF